MAGISANGRFFDLGPVVLDRQTNLMWEKKDRAGGLHDVTNVYTWCEATGNSSGVCAGNASSWIDQVNAEVFAGFSNWRMPTVAELLTIFDCSGGTPCIDPSFGPTRTSFYWSSAPGVLNVTRGVHFRLGDPGWVDKGRKFYVRAVRSGP